MKNIFELSNAQTFLLIIKMTLRKQNGSLNHVHWKLLFEPS